mmetsp:Transcript_151338/g.267110  ORF Transcript_151338/g.267110 Transcript_151338/m.267110 type:complete len:218 (+) Transcript_151338:488-1141(+)
MRAPPSISVCHIFSARHSCVAVAAAQRHWLWLRKMVCRASVAQTLWHHYLDNVLHQLLLDHLWLYVSSMPSGHYHALDACWAVTTVDCLIVFNNNLCPAIWTGPTERAILARLVKLDTQPCGEDVRERHHMSLSRLVCCIAKDDALVAGCIIKNPAGCDRMCQVRTLLLNRNDDIDRAPVQALVVAVVTSSLDCFTNHLLVVHACLCDHLAEDHHHA